MKIHHLGVAVRSLREAAAFYQEVLGLEISGREEVPAEGVKVAFLPAGEARIELLEPMDESSPIAKFIEKRGEGIHHICLQVSDLDRTVASLKSGGARLIEPEIRTGAGGRRIAFVHPRSGHGVLLELKEIREAQAGPDQEGPFRRNAVVVLYLSDPPGKFWGVLRALDRHGVTVEGVDLRSFDDWIRGAASSELTGRDASVAFFPLSKVSKLLLDRGTDTIPALQDQFRSRVGRSILEFLGE